MPLDYDKRDTGRIPESAGTPLDMVFVQTMAGPDAEPYPDEADDPTVYYCKILKGATFPKTVGAQALTATDTGRRDYVFNLCSGSYIEEDSIVAAFVKNGRLWTMDKLVQQDLLILCHTKTTTTAGDGSLSRISQSDGTVLWTVDFPDDGFGQNREACAATISNDGYIYALVKSVKHVMFGGNSISRAFVDRGHTTYVGAAGTTVGAVYKINASGAIVGSVELPEMHDDFQSTMLGSNFQLGCGSICADPNNPDRIYVGADFDVDGNWLHRIDDELNIVWSFGDSFAVSGDTVRRKIGRTLVTHVTQDGNVYAYNDRDGTGTLAADVWTVTSPRDGIYKVSADGVFSSKIDTGDWISPVTSMPIAAVDHPVEVNTPLFALYRLSGQTSVAYSLGSDFTSTPGYFLELGPGLATQLPTTVSGAVKLDDLAEDFAVANYHYNSSDPDHSFGEVPANNYSKGFTLSSTHIGMHFLSSLTYHFIEDNGLSGSIHKFFSYPMLIWNFNTWDVVPETVPWSGDNGFEGPITPFAPHPETYACCFDPIGGMSYTAISANLLSIDVARVSPVDPTVDGSTVWRERITPFGLTDTMWPWHIVARTTRR